MAITRHQTTGWTIYSQRIAQLDLTIVVRLHTSHTNATVYCLKGEAPKGYEAQEAWLDANLEAAKPVGTLSRRGYFDTIKRKGAPWSMHDTTGEEIPHTMSNAEWVSVGHLMLRLALAMVDKAKAAPTQPETSDREYNWATNEAAHSTTQPQGQPMTVEAVEGQHEVGLVATKAALRKELRAAYEALATLAAKFDTVDHAAAKDIHNARSDLFAAWSKLRT